MPRKKKTEKHVEVVGFLGVGLDDAEGHNRVTTGENFLLVGGSEETHERMVETAININEVLQKEGKHLEDATVEEIVELVRRASR